MNSLKVLLVLLLIAGCTPEDEELVTGCIEECTIIKGRALNVDGSAIPNTKIELKGFSGCSFYGSGDCEVFLNSTFTDSKGYFELEFDSLRHSPGSMRTRFFLDDNYFYQEGENYITDQNSDWEEEYLDSTNDFILPKVAYVKLVDKRTVFSDNRWVNLKTFCPYGYQLKRFVLDSNEVDFSVEKESITFAIAADVDVAIEIKKHSSGTGYETLFDIINVQADTVFEYIITD